MSHAVSQEKMTSHAQEVERGERFEFGKNWSRFLTTLNETRIAQAEASLKEMLNVERLDGKRFLDVGSGSGLFSLAARRLGAIVHSFDYDPHSVACTAQLKRRFFADDESWTVAEGSALDPAYLRSLGQYDIVYSWGVLHHTGQMWQALENVQLPVAPGGRLLIAIYNDTGSQSARWKWIKKTYSSLPSFLRAPFAIAAIAPEELKAALRSLVALRPQRYLQTWTNYDQNRGMSHWHDIIDWVGGHPYEVAGCGEICNFYRERGFTLERLKSTSGLGCNEFVFIRSTERVSHL